ncbi:hypothetical protein BATDEDRAFT_88695 [Batrachochytrium dendrobatidis JAM81]|uniref:ATPase AAA-type core domain-containing protein n=2 Tax=Batrachochytrium dendrobatidis TaxID=109871 RepID=F4P3X9_BATDJ|nr:uncharacterized protein BATDEDRAFT_88695 [Batrachochytrium dendrobatidis JAM81]EGF80552.1 hypothetical protein BATDEDRAFT_88695 [Batrachochytrium dendrobatidis JAM81]OAJ40815.1 hypothetical protein BDEG_24512 [Batrachochytrium dendrobatidis JEL423]|eukprot:XP_006679321.1 hypothetical protein BATDEDRAFT_88695 [Batrachochytrium dendrobatidis JAM81]
MSDFSLLSNLTDSENSKKLPVHNTVFQFKERILTPITNTCQSETLVSTGFDSNIQSPKLHILSTTIMGTDDDSKQCHLSFGQNSIPAPTSVDSPVLVADNHLESVVDLVHHSPVNSTIHTASYPITSETDLTSIPTARMSKRTISKQQPSLACMATPSDIFVKDLSKPIKQKRSIRPSDPTTGQKQRATLIQLTPKDMFNYPKNIRSTTSNPIANTSFDIASGSTDSIAIDHSFQFPDSLWSGTTLKEQKWIEEQARFRQQQLDTQKLAAGFFTGKAAHPFFASKSKSNPVSKKVDKTVVTIDPKVDRSSNNETKTLNHSNDSTEINGKLSTTVFDNTTSLAMFNRVGRQDSPTKPSHSEDKLFSADAPWPTHQLVHVGYTYPPNSVTSKVASPSQRAQSPLISANFVSNQDELDWFRQSYAAIALYTTSDTHHKNQSNPVYISHTEAIAQLIDKYNLSKDKNTQTHLPPFQTGALQHLLNTIMSTSNTSHPPSITMDWTHKYQPTSTCEMLGEWNVDVGKQIVEWLWQWKRRSGLLTGSDPLCMSVATIKRPRELNQIGAIEKRKRSDDKWDKGIPTMVQTAPGLFQLDFSCNDDRADSRDFMEDIIVDDDLDSLYYDTETAKKQRHTKLGAKAKSTGKKSSRKASLFKLIVGPTGCGKSALVYAAAKECGYLVVEMNGSQRRTGKDLVGILGEASLTRGMRGNSGACFEENMASLMTRLNSDDNDSTYTVDTKSRNGKVAPKTSQAKSMGDAARALFSRRSKSRPSECISTVSATVPSDAIAISDNTVANSSTANPIDLKHIKLGDNTSTTAPLPLTKDQAGTLLLIEDVDILLEEDRGFWTGVATLIETSRTPIILTCTSNPFTLNNPTIPSMLLPLLTDAFEVLELRNPEWEIVQPYLHAMGVCEHVVVHESEIERICKGINGGLRQFISTFQAWYQIPTSPTQCVVMTLPPIVSNNALHLVVDTVVTQSDRVQHVKDVMAHADRLDLISQRDLLAPSDWHTFMFSSPETWLTSPWCEKDTTQQVIPTHHLLQRPPFTTVGNSWHSRGFTGIYGYGTLAIESVVECINDLLPSIPMAGPTLHLPDFSTCYKKLKSIDGMKNVVGDLAFAIRPRATLVWVVPYTIKLCQLDTLESFKTFQSLHMKPLTPGFTEMATKPFLNDPITQFDDDNDFEFAVEKRKRRSARLFAGMSSNHIIDCFKRRLQGIITETEANAIAKLWDILSNHVVASL